MWNPGQLDLHLPSLLNTMHQASISRFPLVCQFQVHAESMLKTSAAMEMGGRYQIIHFLDHSQTSGQKF